MTYTPGDFLLVDDYSGGSDLIGNLIRAGERARYGDQDCARWTHSALIVSDTGDLVEALANGIRRTNISKYAKHETLVVSPPASAELRQFACRFAEAQQGTPYDVIDFITLAGTLLTGLDLSLHSDKRFICSGLVSRATEAYTDHGYPYPSEQMMPADLAVFWGASTGLPVPALSFLGRLLDKLRAVCRAVSPFK